MVSLGDSIDPDPFWRLKFRQKSWPMLSQSFPMRKMHNDMHGIGVAAFQRLGDVENLFVLLRRDADRHMFGVAFWSTGFHLPSLNNSCSS